MNIIIYYEHLVREWNASNELKKVLEEDGHRVKIFSIIFERTRANLYARKHKPDIVFVPWFVDEEHEGTLSTIIRLNPKVKIINLHQEQIGSPDSEVDMYPKTAYTSNGSYHFAWGEYFKRKLMERGVDEDKIFVTGSIRNDSSLKGNCDRNEIAKEFSLDPNKKWVLFAENRGWMNQRNTEAMKRLLMARGISEEYIEDSIKRTQEGMDELIAQMRALDDSFAKEFEFIYRPHPGTVFSESVPDCVHVIAARSIYDWIHCCDLFLTCESTSIFEAEMCGKPCATLGAEGIPERSQMAGIQKYPKIHSLSEISDQLIEELNCRRQEQGVLYEEFFAKVDGNAAKRTAEACYQVAQMDIDPIPDYYTATAYQNFRQFAYETVLWLVVHLGLFETLKIPKSAYPEKRDIPYSSQNKWIWETK